MIIKTETEIHLSIQSIDGIFSDSKRKIREKLRHSRKTFQILQEKAKIGVENMRRGK